jgi:Domain of unknown function (DUF4136)
MRQVVWAGALLALAGCYPGGAETVTDLDSVTTQHDRSASFSTIHTYALPDSIQEVVAPHGRPLGIDHTYDAQILAWVASNLEALGYTRVDPAVTPADVDVLVTASATRYVEYVSYPFYDYWPGWAGFSSYDASWGVYYPWAYGAAYATVLDAGTLRIEMLDARSPDPSNKQLRAIWSAAVDGVLAGSTDSLLQRIQHGIDQAFAQSSYL